MSAAHPRPRARIDLWRWAGRAFLTVMLLFTALPMAWMLLTSIKSGFAAMQMPPQWWPNEPTLASYKKLLDPTNSVGKDFLRFFWNSLFVSLMSTILSVAVAVPAAYAFSRFDFPGRKFLFFAVLLRNMFPAVIFLVPLFIYSFIGAWNEYIFAYTFINRNDQLTLPIGIQRFFSENTSDFPGLMAASFMMSVPVVVLFLMLQRYFVRALTEGAVKH